MIAFFVEFCYNNGNKRRKADTLSAMVGYSDEDEGTFDKDVKHYVRLVDKMLEKNKLSPRNYE